MSRLAVVELHKEELKFSAGHFMLLSAAHRETMHGHDYQISVAFYTQIKNNGMAFDCRDYKQTLLNICKTLDYRFILPSQSDWLRLEETSDHWIGHFAAEKLPFSKNDSIVLPIANVTLEDLSYWFLQQLTENTAKLKEHAIQGLIVKVFNGRGESGASIWGKLT